MDMVLTEHPATTSLAGDETLVIPGGKTLKIKTSPQGEDILEYDFPEGDDWNVSISIRAAERNV